MLAKRYFGFVATVAGLLMLLAVPLVSQHRTVQLHQRGEQIIQPAHELTNQAIDLVREARSLAFASYMGVPDRPTPPYKTTDEEFRSIRGKWMRVAGQNEPIKSCGDVAFNSW